MKLIRTMLIVACSALLTGCVYKTVADASYPEQKIYIAVAAQGGVYNVSTRPAHSSNTPTQGSTYQYLIEGENFIVPLAVYRSGIDNAGDVRVSVSFDDSIVDALVSSGELSGVTPLPENSRSVESSVVIPDGRESVSFFIRMPLSTVRDAADGTRFACGVRISSEDREVNEEYGKIAVVIDHGIFEE